jgi:hypothetical protein
VRWFKSLCVISRIVTDIATGLASTKLRGDLYVGMAEQLLHQAQVAGRAQRPQPGGVAQVMDPRVDAGLGPFPPVRSDAVIGDRVTLALDALAASSNQISISSSPGSVLPQLLPNCVVRTAMGWHLRRCWDQNSTDVSG